MPDAYLSTYNNATNISLGNDNNTDLATDINIVNISGDISNGATLIGGAGRDSITAKEFNNNSVINMGAGDDSVTLDIMGQGSFNPILELGTGADKLELNVLNQGSIRTGDDVDVDSVEINTINGGFLNLGNEDVLTNIGGTGYTDLASSGVIITANEGTILTLGELTGSGFTINMNEGDDKLVVSSSSNFNWRTLVNIETADLGNTGSTIRVNNNNPDGNEVYITGGANDKVDFGDLNDSGIDFYDFSLAAVWSKGASVVGADGNTYDTWSARDNTVYVDQNIGTVI